MINLKEIDAKIDQILADETSESLTNWLLNERNKEWTELLGNGSFINLKDRNVSLNSMKTTIIYADDSKIESRSGEFNHLFAA